MDRPGQLPASGYACSACNLMKLARMWSGTLFLLQCLLAMRCRGQLASDEVQLLLWQILHVLKYLHANNVWHRDLKSANVLVKLENGQRIIKVCLFMVCMPVHTSELPRQQEH